MSSALRAINRSSSANADATAPFSTARCGFIGLLPNVL
jgi:hypothetical protein